MPRKFDFLSPGIEIREVDQSILPAEVDADGPVIIGRFRKGPGMKPAKFVHLTTSFRYMETLFPVVLRFKAMYGEMDLNCLLPLMLLMLLNLGWHHEHLLLIL